VGVGFLEEGIAAMRAGFQEGLMREVAHPMAEAAVRRHTVVFVYGVSLFLVLPLLGVFLIR
jgi:hypothetical protein